MTLDEALYYIHSVCWKGSVPGLERISALLDKMGHPERKLKFIHVTGTNGKGSTCAMLASMFTKAGYKTGLYTSPFLIRFNERIQIDGVQISDEEICRITEYIKPLADSIFEQPTEFEMVTALGFEYFARQGCDLVVCEVGMGGEFDATNVILPPEAAVICNIGLDHTEVLGDTLEKIAATKSGIIKPGCDAVIYREQPSVEAVIEDRCKAVGAKLHKADFADIHLLSHDLTGQVFDWERFKRLKLPLLGDHQLHNAAVALTTATVMQQRGWKLTDDDIREGLASVRWPGRFDVRRSDPLFIIDGGFSKAYQKVTGIAGYTLVYNSYGLLLVAHDPFVSVEEAVRTESDIHSQTMVVERTFNRLTVADTDAGREIQERIHDLEELLRAYRSGEVTEKN